MRGLTALLCFSLLLWSQTVMAQAPPLPEYYSEDNIHLSAKEQEALRLASEWSDRPIKPIQLAGGKVVYVHGASLPTIISAPMHICDIELESGEMIFDMVLGDTARWLVESGTSGNGVSHVYVKPLDVGLNTSLVITTNRRVYHLKLISRRSGHTPYIGFLYKEQVMTVLAKDKQERMWASGEVNGQQVDMSGLDFNYAVKGNAPWKPVQVFNDGRQTFIKLPESSSRRDIPVLLAMQGKREMMINYRVKNNTFEVDGLFDHLILISGVGGDQKKVNIKKEIKK